MKSLRSTWLFSALAGAVLVLDTSAQGPNAPIEKLPLTAELVLSPDFCAAKKGPVLGRKLHIGEIACDELPSMLSSVFANLKTVENAPVAGASSSQLVLIPKFVEIDYREPQLPTSQRELVVLLEWTVVDAAGRTIWLQTLQGVATGKMGWLVTKKRQATFAEEAVQEIAKTSAARISTAREIRKLIR